MARDFKGSGRLRRRPIAKLIFDGRDDILCVTGLSGAAYDSVAARGADCPLVFNLHGALGGGAMVGLGLALAQPRRRVVVLMGDGDMLMGLGSLATIAAAGPENLAIAVFDNEIYGETGDQETATRFGVDLAGIARAAGFRIALGVAQEKEVARAVRAIREAPGPVFVAFKVSAAADPPLPKSRDGAFMKIRFRQALLGEP
jgi:thiamine pyrophosphate-dependent acetolactate synthase large subunit-like protein